MKRILLVVLAVFLSAPAFIASAKGNNPDAAETGNAEIHWISIDELQAKMREQPRKVYMDIYTDWCGWCKVMEKKTFTNANVIKYMNEKFYCVRFNAERQDTIRFMGKNYPFDASHKGNTLAVELMRGQMSYPTSIIMEERFQNPQPIPGYQDVPTIEKILKYFGENTYKSQPWPEFEKSYKPTWQ